MNFLRGIFSISIIVGCVLNWILIDIRFGFIGMTGLEWPPTIILLLASFLSTGYAFYSSYNESNQNTWIYLTIGLYGIGISVYLYLTLQGYLDFMQEFFNLMGSKLTDLVNVTFDYGFYITALSSVLLFFSGFDKTDNKKQGVRQTFEQSYSPLVQKKSIKSKNLENADKPNLQDWLKENPGKTINDYFTRYR